MVYLTYNLIDFVYKKYPLLLVYYSTLFYMKPSTELTKGLDAYCIEAIFTSAYTAPQQKKSAHQKLGKNVSIASVF